VPIDQAEVVEIVRRSLDEDMLESAIVLWDRSPRVEGESVRIARATHAMPFDGTIVFADLAPRANWAHPCVYLLIADDGIDARMLRASFPPFRGEPPASYVEILRNGEVLNSPNQHRSYDEQGGEES